MSGGLLPPSGQSFFEDRPSHLRTIAASSCSLRVFGSVSVPLVSCAPGDAPDVNRTHGATG